MQNKKILITGSSGFIGFHLSKRLLDLGFNVVGIDNFNDYYDVSLKEARNKILEDSSGYKIYRGDLCDKDFLKDIFHKEKFDLVINLAAQAGVRFSLENPSVYIQSNIVGFSNLIEEVHLAGIKDFIYASSSSVYGANSKVPFSIEDRVDCPVSLYAATKKANELIAYTYSHLYGINTTGLRFFTVYGPFGRPDMACFSFVKNIFNNEPIKIFNNGDMYRDFTYVDDIVDGVLLAMKNMAGYKIYNLGNNNPVKLSDFINILEGEIGKVAIKKFEDMQPGDVLSTYADIDKTKEELNWSPMVNVKTGLKRFINWYKEYYDCK